MGTLRPPYLNGPHVADSLLTDRTREQIQSQLGQSMVSPGSCPLRGGPLELGLMSVAELQVSLVRLVRFTMLESLPLRLFVDS